MFLLAISMTSLEKWPFRFPAQFLIVFFFFFFLIELFVYFGD